MIKWNHLEDEFVSEISKVQNNMNNMVLFELK